LLAIGTRKTPEGGIAPAGPKIPVAQPLKNEKPRHMKAPALAWPERPKQKNSKIHAQTGATARAEIKNCGSGETAQRNAPGDIGHRRAPDKTQDGRITPCAWCRKGGLLRPSVIHARLCCPPAISAIDATPARPQTVSRIGPATPATGVIVPAKPRPVLRPLPVAGARPAASYSFRCFDHSNRSCGMGKGSPAGSGRTTALSRKRRLFALVPAHGPGHAGVLFCSTRKAASVWAAR